MPKLTRQPKPIDLDDRAPALATFREAELTIGRSESSLRRDIAEGRLRAVKIGRSVRIDVNSLRALVRGVA